MTARAAFRCEEEGKNDQEIIKKYEKSYEDQLQLATLTEDNSEKRARERRSALLFKSTIWFLHKNKHHNQDFTFLPRYLYDKEIATYREGNDIKFIFIASRVNSLVLRITTFLKPQIRSIWKRVRVITLRESLYFGLCMFQDPERSFWTSRSREDEFLGA